MPTPDPKSHWKSLAASLGAEVKPDPTSETAEAKSSEPEAGVHEIGLPPAEPPAQLEAKLEQPVIAPQPAVPNKPAELASKPRKKSHWSSLLGALGLESPQAEVAETEEHPAAEPLEAVADAGGSSLAEPVSEPSANVEGDQGYEESDPLVMSSENVIDVVASAVVEDEDEEGERPRHRRRRGGRRSRNRDREPLPTDDDEREAEEQSQVEVADEVATEAAVDEPDTPDETEQDRERPRRRRRRGRRRSSADASSEEQSDDDEIAPVDGDIDFLDEAAAALVADEDDEEEEERPRRSRRRRGRRRPAESRSEKPESSEAGEVEIRSGDEADADEGEEKEKGEGEEERPRRRRRRRGRRRTEATGEATESIEGSDPRDDDADDDELPGRSPRSGRAKPDHDERSSTEDEEMDGDHEGDESSGELSHRKLPSWAEAIDVIVQTNLAGRSKSSRGQGPRGGGGRRR